LSEQLEGAARPGHFRGVATVLAVLFNVVRPDTVFFGQKDAQQTLVVKRLVRDLAFDAEVVVLPTLRETSGLALSSRNAYLNDAERQQATALYRALQAAKAVYKNGERSARRIAEIVSSEISREPGAQLEYVSVTDADTLERLDKLDDRTALVAVAAHIGRTRLIDNVVLCQSKLNSRTMIEP
jgi:pantoate--beta-alanine ligase